ncbi:hypothetical protein SQ03_16005 [Methylobacterium platani JCM 14648]|uniref:Uncharacterized protein n=2 Tax=Methylobacterium platani TaxID=427683 RepID=A0A179S846_9HYPH|nr:hypothetical protein SQ03_16005 [Methylobacterium platani JCM 14648]OAS22449.1 hypothetical protein A5481_18795 [Methylobacterium platani]
MAGIEHKFVSTSPTIKCVVAAPTDYLIRSIVTIERVITDISFQKIISIQSFNNIVFSTSFYILRSGHAPYVVYTSQLSSI